MAKRKGRSLKAKFTFYLVTGIFFISFGILFVVQELVYESLKSELISRGEAIGSSIAKSSASLISENDRVLLNQRINDVLEFEAVSYVIIEDDTNGVISDSFGLNTPANLNSLKRFVDIGVQSTKSDTLLSYSFQGIETSVYEVLSPVEEGIVGYVRIGMLKSYIDAEIEKTIFWVLITIGGSVIFSIILAYLLVNSITKPIVSLTESADKVSMGNLSSSVNIDRKDEIGDLGNAIERMRESLKAAIERLRKQQSMRV
jgi:methyl-accepting chemotaxis protein